jgi:hypothetical protein
VLQGRRRWHALGEAVEVDGVLRGRRQRRAPGEVVKVDGMLQGRRWQRAPGEAIEVEGTLCRRRRAPGVSGVEDIKHTSGKNLLSVEPAARAPDIYIRVRCTTHIHRGASLIFSGASRIIFK